jgi:hypothetical protein
MHYEKKERRATELAFKAIFRSLVGLLDCSASMSRCTCHVPIYGRVSTPRRSATRCVPFVIWKDIYRTNTKCHYSSITDSVNEGTRQLLVRYKDIVVRGTVSLLNSGVTQKFVFVLYQNSCRK